MGKCLIVLLSLLSNCTFTQVEQDTAQSMQILLQLDNIKSRMQDASDALQVTDFLFYFLSPIILIFYSVRLLLPT